MRNKTWTWMLAFILALTVVIVPTSESQAQNNESVLAPVDMHQDKWAVISNLELAPSVDGILDEQVWQEASVLPGDFLTPYYNEPAKTGAEVKVYYDDSNVYIGFESANSNDTIVHFEVLLSPSAYGGTVYRIPVKIKDQDVPYANDWGAGIVNARGFTAEVYESTDGVTAEIAIPLSSIGVSTVTAGEEWRFNAIVQHEMETEPFSSWVPVRSSVNWYNGRTATARIQAQIILQDRFGSLYMGALPEDEIGGNSIAQWEPEDLDLSYTSYNEKQLSFQDDSQLQAADIQLYWRAPNDDWQQLNDFDMETEAGLQKLTFNHPDLRDRGLYHLKMFMEQNDGDETLFSILTFDRHALVHAGDTLLKPDRIPGEDKVQVSWEAPSEEILSLLEIIPEKTGFRFTGLPENPALHPDRLYTWSIDDPWVLKSSHS